MYQLILKKSSTMLRYSIIFSVIIMAVFFVAKIPEMPIDILPEFQPLTIEVQTEALGLSASEVENFVTLNLEEMLSNTPWMEEMHSKSVPGLSSITLKFRPGTDIMRARQMVAESLIFVNTIPNVSQTTIILQPQSTTNRVMAVGLTSDDLSLIDVSELSRWSIRPALMSLPGVANVSIWGHRERQLQAHVDQKKMQANGVSLNQVIETTGNALWMSPLTFLEASTPGSGGWIDTPNQRLGIRHVLPISDEDDLAKISVSGARNITLNDITETVEGHQPLIGDAVFESGNGILLVIEKYPNSSALEVTRAVEAKLGELKVGLSDLSINSAIFRQASFIEVAIDNLIRVFSISAVLIIFALFLLFYRKRIAMLAFISIVFSLMASFLVLYLLGFTANTLMLVGIISSLIIVIDQMVVGFGKKTRGAVYATIIAASLVLPVFFIQSEVGLFFKPLISAYVISLLSGMIFSLIVFPVLVTIFSSERDIKYSDFSFILWLQRVHVNVLKKIFKTPIVIWLIVVVALVASTTLFFKETSLLPVFEDSNLIIELEGVPGTSLLEMNRIVSSFGDKLQSIDGVNNFGAQIGRAIAGDEIIGIESAKIFISIDQSTDYQITKDAITKLIGEYPEIVRGMNTYSQEIMEKYLGDTNDMFVRIYGSDFDILKNQAEEVKKHIARIEGITNPSIIYAQTYEPGIEILVDSVAAQRYNLKPGDVRRAVSTLINGIEVGSRFGEQKVYQVVVWGKPEGRGDLDDVKELLIDTPNGGHVRLADVADVKIVSSLSKIERESMSRYIDIGFELRGVDNDLVSEDIENTLQKIEFPLEYHAVVLGDYAQKKEEKKNVLWLIGIVALGIFLLLQSSFNSWRLAILSFITIPTALSGGLLAVYFFEGGILSLGAMVGFLTILGVAARNGIMLIGHFQYLEEEEGETFGPALVLRGAKERLTPILMTAFTTGMALIPLVVAGNIPGHEIEHPMAIVILGGLFTSTLLNIFIIPALYLWTRNKFSTVRHWLIIIVFVIISTSFFYLPHSQTEDVLHQGVEVIPAYVEKSEEGDYSQIVLSQRAAERLGLETKDVSNQQEIPYSSIVYDEHGETWVYIDLESFTYVKRGVNINNISGDQVFLSERLPADISVVTVGVPELLGIEHGIGVGGSQSH